MTQKTNKTKAAQADQKTPSFRDIVGLSLVLDAKISPSGSDVVFVVRSTDWEGDRFATHLWVASFDGRRQARRLTYGAGTDRAVQWSPDGKSLAFIRRRGAATPSAHRLGDASGAKTDSRQIWLISPDGGESRRLTDCPEGVLQFSWSPSGKELAYQSSVPESAAKKKRKSEGGDYFVFDEDAGRSRLQLVRVATGKSRVVFDDPGKSVHQHSWSPNGKSFALALGADTQIKNAHSTSLYVLDIATQKLKRLRKAMGPDFDPTWSPDGKQIAFSTTMGKPHFYPETARVAVIPVRGGDAVSLTDAFDENATIVQWDAVGIAFEALHGMSSHLFRLDPKNRKITRTTGPDDFIGTGYDLTSDGSKLTCLTRDATSLAEVLVSETATFSARRLTSQTRQTRRFTFGTREVVRWKSKDGTPIEGVLYKPANFNPKKKHPLFVVIHGGPQGTSRPVLDPAVYVYPVEHWLSRGAVVLNPNYRGSAGYGGEFRRKNVGNLGVGDMWDVMSGVDSLVRKGFVDTTRMGAMGWSQGGYISAFLATNTKRFQAISVGAGISNWVTYYVQTDATPFTVHYLGKTPWKDPEVYAKTSPMTTITKAKTPTLIQHGEFDLRVPTPNAYELRQGLEDQGVPVKMVLYKGQGHGLSTPKLIFGALEHNRAWFDQWVFGDSPPK